MDAKRAHSRKLMHQAAFIAGAAGSWRPMIILDISTHALTVACSELMTSGESRTIRFTLPEEKFENHAFITLVCRSTDGVPSGYKYGAKFSMIDPSTTRQIVDFLSAPAGA